MPAVVETSESNCDTPEDAVTDVIEGSSQSQAVQNDADSPQSSLSTCVEGQYQAWAICQDLTDTHTVLFCQLASVLHSGVYFSVW